MNNTYRYIYTQKHMHTPAKASNRWQQVKTWHKQSAQCLGKN